MKKKSDDIRVKEHCRFLQSYRRKAQSLSYHSTHLERSQKLAQRWFQQLGAIISGCKRCSCRHHAEHALSAGDALSTVKQAPLLRGRRPQLINPLLLK